MQRSGEGAVCGDSNAQADAPETCVAAFRRFADALRRLHYAVRRGAGAVTSDEGVIRDVEEIVVDRWEDHMIGGRPPVEAIAGWGSKVARREAVRILRRRRRVELLGDKIHLLAACEEPPELGREVPRITAVVEWMDREPTWLSTNQRVVVLAVLERGSVRAAARALMKDRTAVRRLFIRALAKLAQVQGGGPVRSGGGGGPTRPTR